MILRPLKIDSPSKCLLIVILHTQDRASFLKSAVDSLGPEIKTDAVILIDDTLDGPAITLNKATALFLQYKFVLVLDDDNRLLNQGNILAYLHLQAEHDDSCFYYSDIYYTENGYPKGIYRPRQNMTLEQAVVNFNLWGAKIYRVSSLSASGFFFESRFGYDMMTCFRLLRSFPVATKMPFPINQVTIHDGMLSKHPDREQELRKYVRIAKTWL